MTLRRRALKIRAEEEEKTPWSKPYSPFVCRTPQRDRAGGGQPSDLES
jgi:hypothetical protein